MDVLCCIEYKMIGSKRKSRYVRLPIIYVVFLRMFFNNDVKLKLLILYLQSISINSCFCLKQVLGIGTNKIVNPFFF